MPAPCPICAGARREVFTRLVLKRHAAHFEFCDGCGFLQVRDPHWLGEAYAAAIAATDTGLVARNLQIADRLEALLPALDGGRGPYLDQGGGTGLLVRLMRDRGFDFRWADAHAENVLARGFERDPDEDCAAVVAIEVLEHVTSPVDFVAEALAAARCRTLIFTTELFSGEPPHDWWYYAEATGQHIGFFRRDTLAAIGARLGLRALSDGGLHMLTDRALGETALRRSRGRIARAAARLRRRQRGSLLMADHVAMTARLGGDDAR